MADFGVIFDADGVLFDSERQSFAALRMAIEDLTGGAVSCGDDQLASIAGKDDASLVGEINAQYHLSIDPAGFMRYKLDCYHQVLEQDPIRTAPGAIELLDTLSATSIPYAIATSAIRAKVDLSLKTLNLQDRFPVITSADDVSRAKPHPQLFLLTAQRLGLPPGRIIIFEDAVNGILAANRAEMLSVGIVGTFSRERLVEAEARKVIDSLCEVSVAVLQQWIDSHRANSGDG